MDTINRYFEKARNSVLRRKILNLMLWRLVPFNRPHRLKIMAINDDGLTVGAGYIKPNRNHIRGMHACLLAALCEYTIGLNLMLHLSSKEYRIIMKSIHMVYHYQAKGPVLIKWGISKDAVRQTIIEPLEEEEAVFREYTAEVYDIQGNHICTGLVNWQLKTWKKVRTAVPA